MALVLPAVVLVLPAALDFAVAGVEPGVVPAALEADEADEPEEEDEPEVEDEEPAELVEVENPDETEPEPEPDD